MKKHVQKRLTYRLFGQSEKKHANTIYEAVATSKNPNGEYSNDFMVGIVEVGIGAIGVICGPTPEIKGIGIVIAADGVIKFIGATSNYIWPERDEKTERRSEDRERPSREGISRERSMDRDRHR